MAKRIIRVDPQVERDEALRTLTSRSWPLVTEMYHGGRLADEGRRYTDVCSVPRDDLMYLCDKDGHDVTAAIRPQEITVARRGGTGRPAIIRVRGEQAGYRQSWLFFSEGPR